MPGQADRAVVGEAEPFQHDHPAAAAHAQAGGDTLVGGDFPQLPDDARRFLVVLADPFRKPRPGLDVIVQHVLGDEEPRPCSTRTSPSRDSSSSARRTVWRLTPNCADKLRLGRQPRARLAVPPDAMSPCRSADDLPPQCDPILPVDRMGRLVIHVGGRVHRSFIQSAAAQWHFVVDDTRVAGLAV